jgi:2-keto-4-pentenoate hydratase/2-oxohepta-3-ene-1,7-dioic acid hydratase in catechol pathway
MTKYARYLAHGEVAYGVVEGDAVMQLTAAPFEEHQVTDHAHDISEVELLAPVVPGKVVAIGLNYRSHLGDREPPKVPEPFFKTTSSVIGTGQAIVIPREATEEGVTVQPEAELSLVIAKKARRVTKAEALDYVLGYTCGNDVSARNWQRSDLQWWRAKSSDTFTPLGPFIVTDLDPSALRLVCRINGSVVQDQLTSDLLHDVPTILEFVTRVLTLNPGDVIMTGTPGAPGDIHDGDTVEVEIAEIGTLTNPVKAES